MEEKKSFLLWVKENKKQLIIAGASVAAIVGIILGIKNRKSIAELWATLRKAIEKTPAQIPDINQFVKESSPIVTEVIETTPVPALIVVDSTTINQIPYEVSKHIRNLHEGWHPTAEKIETASENGIRQFPGQTWVNTYTKRGIAA